MKVNGTRGKSATIVHFKHKGQNLHFCNIVQRPFTVMGAGDPLEDQQAEVVIDFEDLHEVQSLIQMLEEFHKFCKMAAGTWQPKYK